LFDFYLFTWLSLLDETIILYDVQDYSEVPQMD
jgi:hypothetical protein